MKEKTRRFVGSVFSNKAALWMNAIFSVMFFVSAICNGRPIEYYFAFAHAMFAALFCLLYIKDKEAEEWRSKFFRWSNLSLLLSAELSRYQKLYGELPKEETKEESHDTDK